MLTPSFPLAILITSVTDARFPRTIQFERGEISASARKQVDGRPCARWCAYHVLAVALWLPCGFALTAFGDILQNLILLCAIGAVFSNVRQAAPKARLFWTLLGLGLGMWLAAQLMWTYLEVYLRHDVPNTFVGDVILFLHIVPMMAAVAIEPHVRQGERRLRVGTLDFALLFTWWLFLYLFVVIPWQYVHPSELAYGRSFDLLYVYEELVLATSLMLVWRRSHGAWRTLYFHLFVATLLYCVASLMASEAIDLHLYYTGSLFDVPLVAGMVWFVRIGFLPREILAQHPFEEVPSHSPAEIWKSRLAMRGRVRHSASDDGGRTSSAEMRRRRFAVIGCC